MKRLLSVFKGLPVQPNTGSVARDHLANERTFLSWTRSALGLIGIGVGLERFDNLHRDLVFVAAAPPADGSRAPTGAPAVPPSASTDRRISLLLISSGLTVGVVSGLRYIRVYQQLNQGVFKPSLAGVGVLSVVCGVLGASVLAKQDGGHQGRAPSPARAGKALGSGSSIDSQTAG